MVVEGDADRPLAVELDGDKYHTPDRWADDLSRQRVMEQVGRRFWRCWGYSFLLDSQGCLADLIATFNELEIRPSAADGLHHRRIEGYSGKPVTRERFSDLIPCTLFRQGRRYSEVPADA